ncbi:hypothetical protein PCASD_10174, partial [Puccinia coronata f. sp. avenae]
CSQLILDKQVLGFDPTFLDYDAPEAQQKIQINTAPNPQELVIDKIIFQAKGICGRGTTCWKAHLSTDKSQKFLIKDSW